MDILDQLSQLEKTLIVFTTVIWWLGYRNMKYMIDMNMVIRGVIYTDPTMFDRVVLFLGWPLVLLYSDLKSIIGRR